MVMFSGKQASGARQRALDFFSKAGIMLTPEEKSAIEVADFGLGDLNHTGLEVLVPWFQAGDEGAVVSEFSTKSRDEMDVFADPDIERITEIVD